MNKRNKLNNLSITSVKKVLERSNSRVEAAKKIGVTGLELKGFIDKYINPPIKVTTKILPCLHKIETKHNILVSCIYPTGSIRKRHSVSIDKNQSQKTLDTEVSEAIEAMKIFLEDKKRTLSIGVIREDLEYTIPGISFKAGNPRKNIKGVRFFILLRKGSMKPESLSADSYDEFCEIWSEATSRLSILNGFKEKPKEWTTPPSRIYYDNFLSAAIKARHVIK